MPTVCTQSLVQGHMDARTHRHKEPLCMWREGTGEIKQGRGRGRGVTRTGGENDTPAADGCDELSRLHLSRTEKSSTKECRKRGESRHSHVGCGHPQTQQPLPLHRSLVFLLFHSEPSACPCRCVRGPKIETKPHIRAGCGCPRPSWFTVGGTGFLRRVCGRTQTNRPPVHGPTLSELAKARDKKKSLSSQDPLQTQLSG